MVPGIRVDPRGWGEGSMVVSAALERGVHDRRNSNRYDSDTQENTHMSKVRRRKRKESAIFD
jgi:hypothetical protein